MLEEMLIVSFLIELKLFRYVLMIKWVVESG